MVEAYWYIGKRIVEEEQKGKSRAEYGQRLVKELSMKLTFEFGKGFSEANIRNFRQFYLFFQTNEKLYALRRELTWTHYRLIMRVENPLAREYYLQEVTEPSWSTRALERQINFLYYERLLVSRNKKPVIKEMKEKTAPLAPTPQDFTKDPYVLEFLDVPDISRFRESELEQTIIDKLREFILELGKGFALVARQQCIETGKRQEEKIMGEWEEYKLGDIAIFKNGKSKPAEEGTFPIYSGNGILGYTNQFNSENEVVVIRRVGAYCGSVYHENRQIWISDNALIGLPKNNYNTKFLFSLLKNPNLNQFAEGLSHPLLTQNL